MVETYESFDAQVGGLWGGERMWGGGGESRLGGAVVGERTDGGALGWMDTGQYFAVGMGQVGGFQDRAWGRGGEAVLGYRGVPPPTPLQH